MSNNNMSVRRKSR